MGSTPGKFIITIDGPAGSGKSTLAKGIARELGIMYVNTGAMYRALALKAINNGIDPTDEEPAVKMASTTVIELCPDARSAGKCQVILDGKDVTPEISRNEVSRTASVISRHPGIREAMVRMQRETAERFCSERPGSGKPSGVVIEGRDTGTVVFPNADIKIFLEASLEERARRRMTDFEKSEQDIQKVKTEIFNRDLSDLKRPVGALKAAADAIMIDNTSWPREKTLKRVLEIIRDRISLPG